MSTPLLPDTVDAKQHEETEDRLFRFAGMRHVGMKRVEICKLMGITGPTHDKWCEDNRVVKWLAELQLKQETRVLMLKDRLSGEAQNILDTLFEILKSETTPAAVRVNVAQDLLDREGSLPKRSVHVSEGERKIFSDEQLDKFLGGLAESAARRNGTPEPG